ncbi:hypothetical protein ACEXQD_17870 [Herbiconiux sp. P15]|uniref:hypothetical protein n=1 Tax=Herbiconiux liukaitaii TaxID=3342799 RepID=UPI0035BA0930
MKKIALITAFALGYVLGSKAGRRRYEQISSKAKELWNDEHVQSAVHNAGDALGTAAGIVGEKVGEKADEIIHKVKR